MKMVEILPHEWAAITIKAVEATSFSKDENVRPIDVYDWTDELNLRIKEGAKRLLEFRGELKISGG